MGDRMAELLESIKFGWCIWDLPMLLLFLAVLLVFTIKHRKRKKEQSDLEADLLDLYRESSQRKLLDPEERW